MNIIQSMAAVAIAWFRVPIFGNLVTAGMAVITALPLVFSF
jgi:hypothetical protein